MTSGGDPTIKVAVFMCVCVCVHVCMCYWCYPIRQSGGRELTNPAAVDTVSCFCGAHMRVWVCVRAHAQVLRDSSSAAQ